MKTAIFVFSLGISLSCLVRAQSIAPLKTINLNNAKITGSKCEIKLQDGTSSLVWLDEQHLAVSSFSAHCPDAPTSSPATTEVAVLNADGSVPATAYRTDVTYFSKGPRGTLAGLSSGKVELLNNQLQSQQTLLCPRNLKACGITLAPSSVSDSEFALCSDTNAEHVCDFYRGWPAVHFASKSFQQAEGPYAEAVKAGFRTAWQIGPKEIWFFDNGRLTRTGADNVSSPVNSEDFVGKEGGGCTGQLSTAEPKRFLAVCVGTHWYSDGMLDAIFGFSRVVLFDVPSGHIIARINGPAYIAAALSPSGRGIAILKGGKVRLYEVN